MKRLIVLFIALITLNAYACETHTYIVDGRMIICTTCGNITNCT
jgi:hypothetical protein